MGARGLLLEIGCEEIPAAALDGAIEQAPELMAAALDGERLSHGLVTAVGTPRRIVVRVAEVAETQDALTERRRGPAARAAFAADGSPTQAAVGFANSAGVPVESLVVESDGQGEYVFSLREEPGRPAAEVLPAVLTKAAQELAFPKMMRWGAGSMRFVRPVRWIVALFGDEVVPFELDGVSAGRVTYGHRFLSPGPLEVTDAEAHTAVLKDQGLVVLDRAERLAIIEAGLEEAAAAEGWRPVLDDPPLSEVVNLVEYPHVLLGSFSEEHAGLPREVLVTAMESHQRYFPVEHPDGSLAAGFLVVHNGDPSESATIVRGHERVLRARLADAEFFFAEDRKRTLSDRVEDLKKLTFQERLGSVYEKAERVAGVAGLLARRLEADEATAKAVERASMLAKADLVTDVVVEFPVLQGHIGRRYAELDGEPETVSEAVFEHYLPRAAADSLPQTLAGQIVAIADKIDTIVGCFAVGLIPTGSEDPYALRRNGLGIVRIAVEKRLSVTLADLLESALSHYDETLVDADVDGLSSAVRAFMIERMRSYELSGGVRYDRVESVLAQGVADFGGAHDRIAAIGGFMQREGALDLLIGFKRAANLGEPALGTEVDDSIMGPAEKALADAVATADEAIDAALGRERYPEALAALAALRGPIDRFFIDVLVMDEDVRLRKNRLRLLNRLVSVFERLADFSKIVED